MVATSLATCGHKLGYPIAIATLKVLLDYLDLQASASAAAVILLYYSISNIMI